MAYRLAIGLPQGRGHGQADESRQYPVIGVYMASFVGFMLAMCKDEEIADLLHTRSCV
jgi:hypothetical protein